MSIRKSYLVQRSTYNHIDSQAVTAQIVSVVDQGVLEPLYHLG